MPRLYTTLATLGAFAAFSAGPTQAAVLATLSATYEGGQVDDTVFSITNDTATAETIALSTSLGATKISLPTLAASATEQYEFNAQQGGFLTDPASAGTPDSTTYQVSVTQGGATLSSTAFSPINNQTGGYVDFLGNTCDGFTPCNVATSGVVASVATVPEPFALSILMTGLVGLAVARRRTL